MHDAPSHPDQRRLRTERSTAAVIDAILDLYREGNLQPGASQVAERAGVSERTVFRLFADLDGLATMATERHIARVAHLFEPPDGSGSRDERIAALITHRMTLYGEVAPVIRASQLKAPFSPVIQAGFERRRAILRRQVERQFAPELDRSPPAERGELLAALDVATALETLELLIAVQGRSEGEVRSIVGRMVGALLGAI
jgi:TetR/AcrR family transcriptional regulator, regulator of autoinduction and epiphytic fitness